MKDFFVSYNHVDSSWAEWIAWQLEETGYTTVLQAWDFRPGANFVLAMQQAAVEAARTIAVLSPDYLASRFTQPEWAAAFAQDPTGAHGMVLPVRVRACDPEGLLGPIVYIDLLRLDEDAALAALLAGVQRGRAKPTVAPGFPGEAKRGGRPPARFPVNPTAEGELLMTAQQNERVEEHPPARGIVEFRLETDLESFQQIKANFLVDLAHMLRIHPEEIRIVSIYQGCVNLRLELPEEAKKQLEYDLQHGTSAALEAFRKQYGIERIRFDPQVEAPALNLSAPLKTPKRSLTWLHLSDMHFRSDGGAMQFAQNLVLGAFMQDLPGLLAERELAPDFIFFTGDVAFSGQQEEYKAAKNFLRPLVEAFPSKKPLLFLVPGNHDVTWDMINPAIERDLRRKLTSHDAVNKYWLESPMEKATGLLRLKNFWDFVNDCSLLGQPAMGAYEYFYLTELEHQDLRIRIVGLNSAWRSTRKDDTKAGGRDIDIGGLLLGQHQVETALEHLESAEIKIALLHHPPASMWFQPFDSQMQSVRLPHFNFVLRGHEHQPTALGLRSAGAEWMHIASGALYDHQEYPNGFNAVRLDLDRGTGVIFLWRYYKETFKWRKDVSLLPDGFDEFELPKPRRRQLHSAAR